MAPILRVMSDGETRDRHQIADLAADEAGVTADERKILVTTGPKYANRVGWALSYLTLSGAVDRPQRNAYIISEVGRTLLARYPKVTTQDVFTHTGYKRSTPVPQQAEEPLETAAAETMSPTEMIDQGVKQIHAEVTDELLSRLHAKSPTFFEEAVVKLLVAMGYGGADGQARVTQASGDGGIDGVIDQDTLGLSRVYVQAKRYAADNSVGRPEIQAFVGALSGRADGGVFITTGRFSQGAREYARSIPSRIILIDGERLASLMIRFGVGVQVKQSVQLVEIDEDFFE